MRRCGFCDAIVIGAIGGQDIPRSPLLGLSPNKVLMGLAVLMSRVVGGNCLLSLTVIGDLACWKVGSIYGLSGSYWRSSPVARLDLIHSTN